MDAQIKTEKEMNLLFPLRKIEHLKKMHVVKLAPSAQI
jgi:hypothetical protein